MKKILGKKLLGVVLIIAMVYSLSLPVYAENTSLENVIDGSRITNDNRSEAVFYNVTRGNILNRGIAKITDNGNGSVNVYGAVLAATTCDKLQLELVLQKLEGGNWVTVTSRSYTAYNVGYLSRSFDVSVNKSYSYRAKAACIATDGGVSESQVPITDGIKLQ